jgi:ATP-binding cassette subfamily F protein 3
VGQNGSGKSTLLRIIAGMERPQSGIVRLGHNVLFDYFAQEHAENLNNHNTVLHEIESDAPFSMIPHLRHILGAFLFSGDDIYKTVNVLSGGEKSRLALAKMLLKPTNFLVLDEPTNHIDITTKKILKKALLDYAGSLLIVSHDRDFLDGLVTKVYELKNGNIHVHLGSFKDFLEKKTSTLHRESQDCRDGSSGAQIKHTADICGNMAEKAKQVLPPKPEKNSLQKQQYLYKKEQNARKRKLEKEIQGIEEKIVLLERQKKELDHILYDPKLYEDKEKSVEINRQYKTVTQELNTLYTQWESVHANLESLIETISSHTSAEG